MTGEPNIPLIEHKITEVNKKVDAISTVLTKTLSDTQKELGVNVQSIQKKLEKIGEALVELKIVAVKDKEAIQKELDGLKTELTTHSKDCPLNPVSIKKIVKDDVSIIANELDKEFLNKEQIEQIVDLKISEAPKKWTKSWGNVVQLILNLAIIGGLAYSIFSN